MKVLIADKLSQVGIDWLSKQGRVDVDVKWGLSPEELAEIVGGYDGMIIRSGVSVTAEVLANPGNLKCIARAGVGVDNVDVPTATAKGIIVMNTPGGNTISTCELAWALMLALSRKIVPANVSLVEGAWERKKFQGTQLAGKTLGIVGMGRVGTAMAKRALAMEMRVLAFDPYFGGESPEGSFERVKTLDELCKRCDYITVHVPKSAETSGMIGREQIALMKDGVRLVNAARGGIIDPEALLEGLESGKVGGAAIDVWTAEPPQSEAEKKLIAHPNVLGVPHLGASTEEAQDQVALDAAQQLVAALRGEGIRNALNAPGFDKAIAPALRPYTELARRMGSLLSGITPGAVSKVRITYRGLIADMDVAPVTTYLLMGLMSRYLDAPVNLINAPVLAAERGIEVDQVTSPKVKEFANVLQAEVETDRMRRTGVGTIFGNKFPRVLSIDGYHMELKPEGHVVIILNEDRPGVLGQYGMAFARKDVNIADLTFSRKKRSGLALVGINLDSEPPQAVLDEIRDLEFVRDIHYLHLPELPLEEED